MSARIHEQETGLPHAGRRILLVDDDARVRESLSAVLTGEGYLVLPAANGKEAVQIVASTAVDLVLLDLNMPVKDGWATLQILSRQQPSLPVAIVTAQPNQLFPALAAGVAALLEKPLDIPHLLQTVRQILEEPAHIRSNRNAGRKESFHYQTPQRATPEKT